MQTTQQKKQKKSLREQIDQLLELWRFLLKNWIIICVFGFAGGGLGILYSVMKKPKYASQLSFALDSSSLSSVPSGLSGIASTFGIGGSTGESVFEGDNFIELIKSRRIVETALLEKVPHKDISFAEYYLEFKEHRLLMNERSSLRDLHFPVRAKRSSFNYQQDSIIRSIYQNLIEQNINIKTLNSKVNIINIGTVTESHLFSRHFPETLIRVVSKFYTDTKTKKAKMNYDVLKYQTDSVRRELYNSLAGFATANDQMYGMNPAFNIQRVPSARKQADVQANTAILGELVKNLELARVGLLNNTPLIQIIDQPRYPLEEIKLRKLHGLIIGGFLGGIFILAILFGLKYFRQQMGNDPASLIKQNNE